MNQEDYYSSRLGGGVATQDFLQPLEKRKEKSPPESFQQKNGLTKTEAGHSQAVKSPSWPGLGIQCGYLEFPRQNQQHNHNVVATHTPNKRSNPVNSEEDETDSDYHRSKMYKGDELKNSELKQLTPRSKHSATEQRRRSKINDRFQMLRDLLPQNDQKRDKASFLQEVVDYIQVLQEKVRHFEQRERTSSPGAKTGTSTSEQLLPPKDSFLQLNTDVACRSNAAQEPGRPETASHQGRFGVKEEEELAVVGGVVDISAAYSHGLLNTLTTAFQNSGLDLSQAHISVRLELGKPSQSSAAGLAKSGPSEETRTSLSP